MTVTASRFERKRLDLYETEKWATEALLHHLGLPGNAKIWEPAAGNHKIADVLRSHGYKVITSDIETYDKRHDAVMDFMGPRFGHRNPDCDAIITNPPYGKGNRQAVEFARLALERCDCWVALLLTAKFDFGKTRKFLFRDNPRYFAKIALLDRIQWFEGATTGTEDHAWYVWQPTVLDRIDPICLYAAKDDVAADKEADQLSRAVSDLEDEYARAG